MVEVLESQGAELPAVAAMFGYPNTLAERELARYKALNHKYLLSLASA